MSAMKTGTVVESVIKNGLSLLVVRGTLLVSSAVVTVFLIRYLGAEGFGSYSAASNIYAVFLPIIFFGFGSVIARDAAKDPGAAWKYFINILYAGFFLTVICTAGMGLFCAAVKYPPVVTKAALILAIGLYPNFIVYIAESLFIGLEKVKYFAAINFLYSVIEVVLMLAVLFLGYKIFAIVAILVFTRYVFAAMAVVLITRVVQVDHFNIDTKFISRLVKVSVVFSATGILAGVLFKIDVLFLSKMVGVYETGIYAAALKLINLCSLGITSFVGVFYPIASKYYVDRQPGEYRDICLMATKCTVLMVFFAIVSTLCLSREAILFLFGTEYEKSIHVLNMLIFLLIPICGTALFGIFLASCNRQKYDLVAITLATLISPALNYYLVKYFSYYGSIYANLGAFSFLQLLQAYFVNKYVFKLEYIETIMKPVAVLAVTVLFIHAAGALVWYARFIIALLVFVALSAAFRVISRKDIELFLTA